MNKRINSKSIVGIIVSVFLLLGIVMPISVMAETPFTIDTALMSATDEPSSYTGGKDAAFAIRPNWVYTYTPTTGYCTETVMKWFGDGLKNPQKTIKIYLNGKELETDEAAESYYSFAVAAPTPSASTGTLIIKPGIEITNDFFATNQIEITDTESGDTVSVGTYVEPEATGPFAIDTALMSVTDEPSSYTGETKLGLYLYSHNRLLH